MSRKLLVVEPDAAGRVLLDQVLTAAGYTVEEFASAHDARILLDDGFFDLAVVDQFGGDGASLEEVGFLRAHFPRLPLVVTGTMLTAPALLALLRLGVADALPKPFTPDELRAAVGRALARSNPDRADALDFAAAVALARRSVATGALDAAGRALARACARCPLDAEVASLQALRAELGGRDVEAARAWRAAFALRDDEGADAPDPREGLARLDAYRGARPVAALGPQFREAPTYVVLDPARELGGGPDAFDGPTVVAIPLSLGAEPEAATPHLRERGDLAFALLPTDLRPDRAGPLLARLGVGPLRTWATSPGAARIVAELAAARDHARAVTLSDEPAHHVHRPRPGAVARQ